MSVRSNLYPLIDIAVNAFRFPKLVLSISDFPCDRAHKNIARVLAQALFKKKAYHRRSKKKADDLSDQRHAVLLSW